MHKTGEAIMVLCLTWEIPASSMAVGRYRSQMLELMPCLRDCQPCMPPRSLCAAGQGCWSARTHLPQAMQASVRALPFSTPLPCRAEMLERMYLRWAEANGYKARSVERSVGEEAGLKSSELIMEGPYA